MYSENLYIEKLSNQLKTKELLKNLNVDKGGIAIMTKKMSLNLFYIKNLYVGGANILKQDALSIGAEFAVPTGVVTCKDEYIDGILIATDKQLKILAKKELAQPYGLKKIAKEIEKYISIKEFPIEIMGVLNTNIDSFYRYSRVSDEEVYKRVEQMIQDGANIIDIGGVSSRPGSEYVFPQEELQRVKPIIDAIYQNKYYEQVRFSLDSYEPTVLEYALDRGFQIVNDITGLENDEVAKISAKYNATVVIMHKKGTPKDMQNNPYYDDVVKEVDEFFAHRVQKAIDYGINDIVLDVGIGFGKRLEDNLRLIKSLSHFTKYNYPLLIGASRKSMINNIIPCAIEDRLAGTIAIHQKSIDNGASIIRCHDVKEHHQAIEVYKAVRGIY